MSSSESFRFGPHKDEFTRNLMVGFVFWDGDQGGLYSHMEA
jgi:hypothetical protein